MNGRSTQGPTEISRSLEIACRAVVRAAWLAEKNRDQALADELHETHRYLCWTVEFVEGARKTRPKSQDVSAYLYNLTLLDNRPFT